METTCPAVEDCPASKKPKLSEDVDNEDLQNSDADEHSDEQNVESKEEASKVMLGEDGKPLSKRAMKRLAKRANFEQWKKEKRYCATIS